jgi:two-component system sensor kinase FixL
VLINLMQNAIDSMGEAGGRTRQLVITLSRTGKGMAEVAVRDSGTGVGKAMAGRLFEPFFSTKSHGLGVGLALSRTIIEAHGGRLWLQPRRGRRRGATFRFTLPLYAGKRAHNAGAAPAPQDREVADG